MFSYVSTTLITTPLTHAWILYQSHFIALDVPEGITESAETSSCCSKISEHAKCSCPTDRKEEDLENTVYFK